MFGLLAVLLETVQPLFGYIAVRLFNAIALVILRTPDITIERLNSLLVAQRIEAALKYPAE